MSGAAVAFAAAFAGSARAQESEMSVSHVDEVAAIALRPSTRCSGCVVELTVEAEGAAIDASVYSASGVQLAPRTRAGSRVRVSFASVPDASYAVVRVSAPRDVTLTVARRQPDADRAADPAAPFANLDVLPVGPRHIFSAPRRAAARREVLRGAGLLVGELSSTALEAVLTRPQTGGTCALLVASVDDGAVRLAGIHVDAGDDVSLLVCDANTGVDVEHETGAPRLGTLWVTSPARGASDPATWAIRAEFGARGLSDVREITYDPSGSAAVISVPIALERPACFAVAALGAPVLDVTLASTENPAIARSVASASEWSTGATIYHCTAGAAVLTASVRARGDDPIQIVVARDTP